MIFDDCKIKLIEIADTLKISEEHVEYIVHICVCENFVQRVPVLGYPECTRLKLRKNNNKLLKYSNLFSRNPFQLSHWYVVSVHSRVQSIAIRVDYTSLTEGVNRVLKAKAKIQQLANLSVPLC